MHGIFAAITMALLLLSSADGLAQVKGTPQEQRACRGDVAKLCRSGMQDEAAVLNCLVSNREKLSKPCQEVLAANGH